MSKTKSAREDELADIKKSLNFMSSELTNISEQQKVIVDLMKEVKELKIQNEEKNKRIITLENRLADLEQYTRINDIIISGLEIKPRTYARAAAPEGEPTEPDLESVEQQALRFLNSKGISVSNEDIEACHILPRKDKQKPATVIMRFVNRKKKSALLRQGRKLKGSNVYINEHLTKKNADIARVARLLRKQNKIQSTWTSNCRIYIKLRGTPEEAKTVWIRELQDLDTFS